MITGQSPPMLALYSQLRKVAESDMPVLLLGETGVGKKHVAHLLHLSSPRRQGPLIAGTCAAIPPDLLEAELFGIVSGVATGVRARRGKFEAAAGDYFRVQETSDFATGDRLLPTESSLCNTWHVRFLNGGGFDGGTTFQVSVPEFEGETWSSNVRVYDEQAKRD